MPTYNRESLLDICLTRLAELNATRLDYEVVVSDNCSSDGTRNVVLAHAEKLQSLSYHRMPETRTAGQNWQNAVRHARGEFVVYVADDDRLITENLAAHVEMMRRRPDLVATYADWICWDDRTQTELHRYYAGFMSQRQEYRTAQRLQAIEFILETQALPEIAIFRRTSLLRALPSIKVGYAHLQILYHLLRQGTIAFDLLPFYVEYRFVKPEFERDNWQDMGLWLINDTMRTSLEMVLLKAYQDLGYPTVPPEARERVREMVERRMQQRYHLEAALACSRRNFILASELHRRWTLWRGHDEPLDMQKEIDDIVVPAALQSIAETFGAASGFEAVAFHGFKTPQVLGNFLRHFPEVPVTPDAAAAWQALQRGEWRFLHVVKSAAALTHGVLPGNVLLFDNLIDMYQTIAFSIELDEL